jgi:flagellar hook-associated protein 1
MASGILGIAVTGLNAAQAGIRTTQHNISNVNTAGYRRQEVSYSANPAQYTGAGYFGAGVGVDTVRRIYSQFLDNEVMQDQAMLSRFETYTSQATQIDKMLGDSGSGLSSSLDAFFNAANELANDPTSNAARQNFMSAGTNLAARVTSLDNKLRGMKTAGNADIVTLTERVNVLTSQVANLNNAIARDESMNGRPANDLRDQRDVLVGEINKLVSVSQLEQSDGSLNLYIGSGQGLVVGTQAYTMGTMLDPNDPSIRLPTLNVSGTTVSLTTDLVTGGELAGIMAMREEVLLPALNDLNRIAIAVSLEVNAVHRNGLQYDAATAGGDFFTPAVAQQAGATGWIRLGDSASGTLMKPENYTASWDGAQFTVTRVSDGQVAVVNPGDEVEMLGVAQGFSLLPNPGEPDATFAAGAGSTWDLNFADFSRTLRMNLTSTLEVAAAGPSATGPGDNSNALYLAQLRNADVLNNGTVSFSEAFAQTISRTASYTSEADLSRSAYTALVNQATASQLEVSGVNLDEEAVNLIRFQQAYQASARAIQVASSLFDEVIGILR